MPQQDKSSLVDLWQAIGSLHAATRIGISIGPGDPSHGDQHIAAAKKTLVGGWESSYHPKKPRNF